MPDRLFKRERVLRHKNQLLMPGPLGTLANSPVVQDGTHGQQASPKPGQVGQPSGVGKSSGSAKTLSCIPGLGVAGVANYVGKSVEEICPFGYGRKKDNQNHCAHFVSHALNIQVGTLCSLLLPWQLKGSSPDPLFRSSVRLNQSAGLFTVDGKEKTAFRGASTRVNEIYNSINKDSKGDWASRPDAEGDCLIYVTQPKNISEDRNTIGQMPAKHIGIHSGGNIYHYGNTDDQVKCDAVEAFEKKFMRSYGSDAVFLWSMIPSTGSQCVHRG